MLDNSLVQEMIDSALATGGDFAEIFAEEKLTNNVQLVSSRVESAVSGRDFGVAVRIFRGLNSVYAYTNKHGREDLLALAAGAARARSGASPGKFPCLPAPDARRWRRSAHLPTQSEDGRGRRRRAHRPREQAIL